MRGAEPKPERARSEQQRAYSAFINSAAWKWIREQALADRHRRCERCGSQWQLHVHHLTYERFGGQELLSDLEVLCRACHRAEHKTGPLGERKKALARQRRYAKSKEKAALAKKKKKPPKPPRLQFKENPTPFNADGRYNHLVKREAPPPEDFRATYLASLRSA